MKEKRSSFTGGIGFVLAAAGSAVGLGNFHNVFELFAIGIQSNVVEIGLFACGKCCGCSGSPGSGCCGRRCYCLLSGLCCGCLAVRYAGVLHRQDDVRR